MVAVLVHDLQAVLARTAPGWTFVHAGVVGIDGRRRSLTRLSRRRPPRRRDRFTEFRDGTSIDLRPLSPAQLVLGLLPHFPGVRERPAARAILRHVIRTTLAFTPVVAVTMVLVIGEMYARAVPIVVVLDARQLFNVASGIPGTTLLTIGQSRVLLRLTVISTSGTMPQSVLAVRAVKRLAGSAFTRGHAGCPATVMRRGVDGLYRWLPPYFATSATARSGPPEPFSIFIGRAMTVAPRAGS